MENEELGELKREMLKEFDGLRHEYKSFKRRTGVIANIFIPGIGFILYGSSYLKVLLSLLFLACIISCILQRYCQLRGV